MEERYNNTECLLHGTHYCDILNMENCEKCTVDCVSQEKADALKKDLDKIIGLMPENGIESLYAGDECRFCKSEGNKANVFALTNIANGMPKHRKVKILGISKEPKNGILLSVQISCCSKCKRAFNLIDYSYPVIACAISLAGLVLLSIRSIRESISAVSAFLPVMTLILMVCIGLVCGKLVRNALIKKYAGSIRLNIMEIPELAEMADNGWAELSPNNGFSKLVFSKSPLKHGLFTRMPDKNQ